VLKRWDIFIFILSYSSVIKCIHCVV
jgi:hypothetical protein